MSQSQDPVRPDVWGVPSPRTDLGQPLDLSQDPDRFDADEPPAAVVEPMAGSRALDPALDPDRYRPGVGMTLPDLLGEGAHEERRDSYTWLVGLLGILAFLAVVSIVAHL